VIHPNFLSKFSTMNRLLKFLVISFTGILLLACNTHSPADSDKTAFLKDLKERTFMYFWELADKPTGQIPDRYPTHNFTSIAATGFGLAAYLVGIENHYITRGEGANRVLYTLNWLWHSRQEPEVSGTTGYKGFYYHFLNYGNGTRYKDVELSTIDTGLLMAGILSCQSYFDRDNETEKQIKNLADSLYLRVEWDWAMNGQECMSMGWFPDQGFLDAKWTGYNEAMILILMALGSPTHPVHDSAWNSWCKDYQWSEFYGQAYVNFTPLFGHQYSHMFIDFRGIQDAYMADKGIDYFENSRRATYSNRAYCMDNPSGFSGYGDKIWGLTACDGPGEIKQASKLDSIQFWGYRARGASNIEIVDDGTIAPTAAGGSIPFAPEICMDALLAMKNNFGLSLYHRYGFKDAFNLTFQVEDNPDPGWFDKDYIGIDQGPILIQLENYQTGLIWELMKKNKYILNGMKKAGFKGGWLE
jgi:hypothetical protein